MADNNPTSFETLPLSNVAERSEDELQLADRGDGLDKDKNVYHKRVQTKKVKVSARDLLLFIGEACSPY